LKATSHILEMKVIMNIAAVLILSSLAASSAVTPIEKVITLLEDLKAEVETEAKDEAGEYDKFACFCKDTTKEKSDAITEGQTTIDDNSATIGEQTALQAEKETKLKKFIKEIETLNLEIAAAELQREKEKAEYDAVIADLSKAISSLEGAIASLEDSKNPSMLVEIKRTIRRSVALADALDLNPKHRRAIEALLQTSQDPDVPETDYEFHSQGIIDLLQSLLKDFNANKADKVAEEEKAQSAHDKLMKEKRNALETAEEGKTQMEEDIDACKEAITKATKSLVEAESALKDDQEYLKDLTERCETKAKDWDQRSQSRADELTALSKAIEVISGAKGVEAARALLLQAEVHVPAAVSQPVVADLMDSDVGDLSISFLQKRATQTPRSQVTALLQKVTVSSHAMQYRINRAIALLATEGKSQNSALLMSLALKVGSDPFKKVKTLIQGLIQRLLTEMADEATHKGFCDTELGKAKTTRDFQKEKTEKLSATLEKLEVAKEQFEEMIVTLTGELKELNAALAEATDLRGKEKESNSQTVKDSKEGLEAIKNAIQILKDFYKGAAKNKSLLQASPIDEADQGVGVDKSVKGAYKGKQDSANGIIGMLEVIQSDFERSVKQTNAAESESHRGFVDFDRTSKTSISSKETGKSQAEADLKSTDIAISEGMKDLEDAQKLLDDSLKEIEELKPACIDTGMSYEERVAAREKEIEALKKALCILDPDGVEESCM